MQQQNDILSDKSKHKTYLKNDNYKYYKKKRSIFNNYNISYSDDVKSRNSEQSIHRNNTDWIDPLNPYLPCDVSSDEYRSAIINAKRVLTKNKKPQVAGLKPKFYITIGAPGSGKSTLIQHVAHKFNPELDFIIIDLDTAVDYHPRYQSIWSAESAVDTHKTNIGYTLTRQICNDSLEGIMEAIFYDIIKDNLRYNIIFQSQDLNSIILARSAGYEVNLVFIGVKLDTAIKRSKLRALKTGKFLASNLYMQSRVVEDMWMDYKYNTAWYSLWSDNTYIIDNNKDIDILKVNIADTLNIKKFDYYVFLKLNTESIDNRELYVKQVQFAVDSILDD
jgi:predicted ABC-type ATPase